MPSYHNPHFSFCLPPYHLSTDHCYPEHDASAKITLVDIEVGAVIEGRRCGGINPRPIVCHTYYGTYCRAAALVDRSGLCRPNLPSHTHLQTTALKHGVQAAPSSGSSASSGVTGGITSSDGSSQESYMSRRLSQFTAVTHDAAAAPSVEVAGSDVIIRDGGGPRSSSGTGTAGSTVTSGGDGGGVGWSRSRPDDVGLSAGAPLPPSPSGGAGGNDNSSSMSQAAGENSAAESRTGDGSPVVVVGGIRLSEQPAPPHGAPQQPPSLASGSHFHNTTATAHPGTRLSRMLAVARTSVNSRSGLMMEEAAADSRLSQTGGEAGSTAAAAALTVIVVPGRRRCRAGCVRSG